MPLNQLFMSLSQMFSRRRLALVMGVLSVAVVSLSILSPHNSLVSSIPFIPKPVLHSFTGLEGVDGPILAVKIDDTRPAHPQIGLEYADVVYIDQDEGGLTRLAALFSSTIPTRIGPVRSARISDIEILEQYGKVIFAYSGAQKKMRPVIAAANLHDLGAERNSPTIYTTDPARVQPYAMVLRADLIMQQAKDRSLDVAESKKMGWNFGDAPDGGIATSDVHISWPASSYDAHWSESEKRWLLDFAGQPNFSDSGKRLGPETLVIQLVSITDSIYGDKFGGVTPMSNTVGTGKGFIMRDGQSFEAIWNRTSETDGTTWTTVTGEEIQFAPGQIWVALTDTEPRFTRAAQDAEVKSSK
jgi:hypothetical protein